MVKENRFYNSLQNIFQGEKMDGQGGFINLLNIKEKYYNKVIDEFKKEVNSDKIIDEEFKEDFFDKLYNFFYKFFNKAGSIYYNQTADWQKVYEKVYEDGKDVVLFWKTNMLYYVKTDKLVSTCYVKVLDKKSDNSYVFKFDTSSLKIKSNNEKKEFLYSFVGKEKGKTSVHDEKSGDITFVISVGYVSQKKNNFDKLAEEFDVNVDILQDAIRQFEKQNSIDFFINKDAKRFLTEQLDLYLHQILLDDSEFELKRLTQYKTIKKYALKLIDFISGFEDELVRIWTKQKFVKKSNYVITIDRLKDDIIGQISENPGLEKQIQEWKSLKIVKDDFKFNSESIKEMPHLPIDTKYFKDLELEILSSFDNLDKSLDGILVHSDNYQALNTLKYKYNDSVQLIYIDPPFNTGTDFVFIDNYQDSSWLSIMNDRLKLSKNFLKENGSYYVELDHIAEHYGKLLLDSNLGNENYLGKITWNTGDNISGFKSQAMYWIRQADYIHFYVKNSEGENKYKFIKVYEPLNKKKFYKELGTETSWLDLLSKKKKEYYIEKWIDGELKEIPVKNVKAKAKGTIWNDIYSFQYSEPRITESISFASNQKPENLLRRIIQSSTEQRDIVFDFFSGSGTTCAVAQKLNRRWLGVEMGEYFYEIYNDTIEFDKKKINEEDNEGTKDLEKNFDKSCIVETIFENDKKVKYLINKIGLLGRMKIVLNGDKTFYSINSKVERKPHLSNDINWQGGGFFKYYELEQYEDTLSKAKYSDENLPMLFDENIFKEYTFFADRKLTDIVQLNNNNLSFNFDKLYENIDLPETISNVLGLPIKKITKDYVILIENGSERKEKYDYKNMTNEELIHLFNILKPLMWWGK